ncbi:phosphotransferase [Clostridium sp. 'deep sea']|uniref:phosphotransferase enzyme family protein n=1 Tax=Clostridium sp. 'deep sea' TaxID=2779445 RepID=UPI0018968C1A|nr:phosphotransferase [Clostridium sp. 'deep sea']QOR36827.1 phosphotransferase [Clostridium sp. 'deep sea']
MTKPYLNLVEKALNYYNITVESYDYLTEATNIFYKVITKDQKKYVLKIFQEESSSLQDNLAEQLLLTIIADKTDLSVPEIVLAKDGRGILQIAYAEEAVLKRVALYKWVAGEEYKGRESYDAFTKIGEITAKLHKATLGAVIPPYIKPKKWDKVFYYQDEIAVYKQEKYSDIINDEYIQIMDRVIPILNTQLKKLYQNSKPQLIHGDINPWNIRIHNGEVFLLDFEEAMLALPIHDIAIHLFYYKYNTDLNYSFVKESFIKGYNKVLSLPKINEDIIEMLMTARRVNFLNYILTVSDNPKEYIRVNIPRVKDFLQKYD